MTNDKNEKVYEIIRKRCNRKFWTSKDFAIHFSSVKFTSRCREMIANGEVFATKNIFIKGAKYKGYQYIGKKAA